MDKILSILIPIYNGEKYITRCLDSILEQKAFDDSVEIVVINDGSTDGSLEILQDYAHSCANLRLISRFNKGIGPTRNELLDNASGRYFWFVDADDYVSEDSLHNIIPLLRSDEYDMVMMGYYWGTESEGRHIECKDGLFHTGIEMADNGVYNNSLWTRVYRTSIINEFGIRFRPFQMGEDFDVIFRILPHLGKCVCINKSLYNYMVSANSAITNQSKEHVYKSSDDSLACLDSNFRWIEGYDDGTQRILRKPLNYFLMGYLYSIYVVPFRLKYKIQVIRRLEKIGVFPINPLPMNKKHRLFSQIINNKILRYISIYIDTIVLWLRNRG